MEPRVYADTSVLGGSEDDERSLAMSRPTAKSFDCVQSMRQVRDRFSREIADMSYEDLARWLRSQEYSDPLLKLLAERAARQGDAADDVSRR
jgi:hypothetical protein